MTRGTRRPPHAPLSTYRFQFNQTFRFRDATALVPYLSRLGIDWLYASPYLQARPGSTHGYDISSHSKLNPEIGTPEEHGEMVRAVREHGMGHLIDIVPNHMGIGQPENEWWMDILENGPSSIFAPFFDVDWNPIKPELVGKVLLPVLGDQFGRVLENGELQLVYEGDGRFRIHYHEHVFPVSPKSSSLLLQAALERVKGRLEDDDADRVELESIVTALEHLPSRDRTDPQSVAERKRENVVTRRRVAALFEGAPLVREAIDESLREFNGQQGNAHSYDRLERVLSDQAYRLAHWRVAGEEINYRRFFDINDLAALRMENPVVFEATQAFALDLAAAGVVDGLRIDHPDGLYDPRKYLRDLQAEGARRTEEPPIYVTVEKILTGDEELPEDWETAGTVGYEYLNRLNGLFVDTRNEAALNQLYAEVIGRSPGFEDLVYRNKKLILRAALASELNVLSYLLDRISEDNRRFRDFTLGSLTDALRETIACFPVYRTYIDAHSGHLAVRDRGYIDQAIRGAIRRNPATSRTVFEFVRNILLLHWPDDLSAEGREQHAQFLMKFQQLTGPVMAKGLEDTTFYVYNRLVSLNEVGGEPSRFGVSPAEFHVWMMERQTSWPLAMSTTSTHDTKRSEDVRARINVLSEIPDEWGERVKRWFDLNRDHKKTTDGEAMPDANDEYLLYQSLVGAWPLGEKEASDREGFVGRVQQYMEKATREGKVHTSWISPAEDYDAALREFVAAVLDPERSKEFLADLIPFQAKVARMGMLNSLSQTALKLTSPGVPDIYQGQEVWDFSLVDPDNRRPVDYAAREAMLNKLARQMEGSDRTALAAEIVAGWEDGRAKLYLTHLLLTYRQANPDLFRKGEYVPLEAHGVRIMSIGFILDPTKALIWRGPLVAQLINQFLNDVHWGDLDYLVLDLPPGTGDVQLTLVQKIPISGAVIVTTPQEVALADAVKGLKMFQEVKTPILGIVENMSGFICPNCETVHPIFGEGGGQRTADEHGVELLGQIPIEPAIRAGGDTGAPIVATAPESGTGQAFAHLSVRVATQ
ncbi:MAG: malto-oligosyltrehalose synthase, partial [Gemmatimonadetes bacterium]|nr:malto-oligosyltrehalose synthase [Gemmatimonadota bacterium]